MTGDDHAKERALVIGAVRAVVERDEPALRAIGAYDETERLAALWPTTTSPTPAAPAPSRCPVSWMST